jgi:hypothetical protein
VLHSQGQQVSLFLTLTGYKKCLKQLQPLPMARQDETKCIGLSFYHTTTFNLEYSHIFLYSVFLHGNYHSSYFPFYIPSICFTLPYNSPVTFLPNSYDLKTNLMFALQFPNSWVVFLHQVTSIGRELFFLTSCFLSTHTWLLALSLLFASTSTPSPLWTHKRQ